jgi:tripartite-type tricarboxylate transporter receptor subunit TctC
MTRPLSRRAVLSAAAALSTSPLWPRSSVAASDWRPTETIRIVVPAAPGGSTDVIGRFLAQHLQAAWGQSTVVENKSGGGGTIGTADFVRQKPDGHTILIGNPGPNAVAYSIFRSLPYKSDQLQPVSNAIRIPNIVSAHPSAGIKSIPELIAYLKANPDKLNYGSSGVGQSPHLTAVWFLQLTGLKMTHIPFRGAGPALTGALAGDVSILFDNLYPTLPQALDGKLVPLAVTTPSAASRRRTCRPCAKARRSSQTSTCRPGSACSCRAARRALRLTRSMPKSGRCWRATISRRTSRGWAPWPTTARRSSSRR